MKPYLCIDFDGVIHSYTSGWKGEDVIPDPPVDNVFKWLNEAQEFFTLVIYSSRSKSDAGRNAMERWFCEWAKKELGETHQFSQGGIKSPIVFAHEKPAAFLTIDDRAICFKGNWDALDPKELLQFKPWNAKKLISKEVEK